MSIRTAVAQGTKLKEGVCRRITVTMDEALFYRIRQPAVAEERSISNVIVHMIKRELACTSRDTRT